MCKDNGAAEKKSEIFAAVLSNEEIAKGIYRMVISSRELAVSAQPGQFVEIKVSGFGSYDPLLRRPMSIADVKEDTVSFIFAAVGRGTKILAHMDEGDNVSLFGPIGTPFTLPEETRIPLVVAGGMGAAPLLFLSRRLISEGLEPIVLCGYRSADLVILEEDFRSLGISPLYATDDGSFGRRGFVTDFLFDIRTDEKNGCNPGEAKSLKNKDKRLFENKSVQDAAYRFLGSIGSYSDIRLYACGPRPMLENVQKWAAGRNIAGEISLESRMACGVGACLGCAQEVIENEIKSYKRVCVDGPVFELNKVILTR